MGEPTFEQGVCWAVAELIRLHGETVLAADVLKSYSKRIDMRKIDSYDRSALEQIRVEGLCDRAGISMARALGTPAAGGE